MGSIFQYFALIFLCSIVTIHAEYDSNPNSCAFAGLGKKSCYGSGTSTIADFFGYTFLGKMQYFIVGSCEGISFVWGMYYQWQQGAQAVVRLDTLYGYILHLPTTNCTKATYLFISVADCPSAYELNEYAKGVVPATELPWKSVFKVISGFCKVSYPADCELIQGSLSVFTDTSQLAYPVRLLVSVPVEGVVSFLYRPLFGHKKDKCPDPMKVAKQYNLDLEQGISDPRLYLQRGTPNGPKYSCSDPAPQLPIGRQLANEGFDVKSVFKPGGLCALAKRLARIFASGSIGVIFGYVIFAIIPQPYTCAYQFNSWYSRIADYGVYQPLFSVC